MANKTLPLCSQECPYHDTYASKVNFMWGAGKVVSIVLVAIFGTLVTMIMSTQADVERVRAAAEVKCSQLQAESVARDHDLAEKFIRLTTEMAKDNNDIVRVLNVISVNQKRILDNLQIPYMAPEWVRPPGSGEK